MKKGIILFAFFVLMGTNAYPEENKGEGTAPENRKAIKLLTDQGGDEKYPEMIIGGRLQVQYRNVEGSDTSSEDSRIFLRRAWLTMKVRISDSGYMVVTPSTADSIFSLQDTHIGFNTNAGTIRIGHHYLPFSGGALTTSKKYQFVEGYLTSQMAPFYQPGLSILSYFNDRKVEIILGTYNSDLNQNAIAGGKLVKNNIYQSNPANIRGSRFLYAGRVSIYPLGYLGKGAENFSGETKYAVALGLFVPDDKKESDATGESLLDSNAAQFDIQLNAGRFCIVSEYAQRNTDWQNSDGISISSRQTSYSVQGTYLLTQKFSVGLRAESMDYDADDILVGGAGQEEDSWTTVGANYYFKQHAMKVQINYLMKDEKMQNGGAKPDNNAILFQAAVYF